jgi:hypothetical protein
MPFRGVTYERDKDGKRLWTQLGAVKQLLVHGAEARAGGQWRTLKDLKTILWTHFLIRASEAGISARIRDLRKEKFGGYQVERKRLSAGLWAYRIKAEDEPI